MGFETMRNAVQTIGEAAGLQGLEMNAKGACELVINGVLPVYFQEVSDTDMEVTTRVEWLDNKLDLTMTESLLAANAKTRAGRFSVEPEGNKVYFGGRINIAVHDKTSILQAVDAIIIEAANWNVTSEGELRSQSGTSGAETVLSETLIRV